MLLSGLIQPVLLSVLIAACVLLSASECCMCAAECFDTAFVASALIATCVLGVLIAACVLLSALIASCVLLSAWIAAWVLLSALKQPVCC